MSDELNIEDTQLGTTGSTTIVNAKTLTNKESLIVGKEVNIETEGDILNSGGKYY